jgi:hypothetical protein
MVSSRKRIKCPVDELVTWQLLWNYVGDMDFYMCHVLPDPQKTEWQQIFMGTVECEEIMKNPN